MKRELPIFPDVPPVVTGNETVRHIVTEIAFGNNMKLVQTLPESIDTVFAFACAEGYQRQAQKLRHVFSFSAEIGQLVITGGRDAKVFDDAPDLGEAVSIAVLRKLGSIPDATKIGMDTISVNTKENAEMGWAAMPRAPKDSIAILTMSFHMGRCHRTLEAQAQKHGWTGDILYVPYQALEPDGQGGITDIRSDNWWNHEIAAKRVWGEVQRIHTYGQRGDIAFLNDDKARYKELRRAGLRFQQNGPSLLSRFIL